MNVGFIQIEEAYERIRNQIVQTPLLFAPYISELAGTDVYLKCENLQRTGSFKIRGALNKLTSILQNNKETSGVITGSSGNHGQAVAYAAKLLGVSCTVVVPEDVLQIKEQAILKYGAEVIRHGKTSSERIELGLELAKKKGLVFVPPYDDAFVIAGQGTAGLEIAHQLPDVQSVFVPVGGGGLLSGISTAIKNKCPNARVYGIEPAIANDTFLSRKEGRIVDIGASTTIADGLRTNHPGELTFPIVQKYVDDILLVSEEEILEAFSIVLESSKVLAEPSGCVSVAAALKAGSKVKGPIVCVISGGNIDLSTVCKIVQGTL